MDAPRHPRCTNVRHGCDGPNEWRITEIAPPPELAHLIDGYGDYTERTGGFTTRRELPHGNGVMIVNLGAPIFITGGDGREIELAAGEAFIAGAHLRPALSHSVGEQTGIHIHLSLASLRRLLGVPLDKLIDRVCPLDAILGPAARAICEPLATRAPKPSGSPRSTGP